jgi:hypothetical protein
MFLRKPGMSSLAPRVATDCLSAFVAEKHAMQFNDSGLASLVELG